MLRLYISRRPTHEKQLMDETKYNSMEKEMATQSNIPPRKPTFMTKAVSIWHQKMSIQFERYCI